MLLSKEVSLENDSFVPLNSENKMIKIDLNKLFPNKQNIKNNVKEQNPEILSYQIILKKFQDLQTYLIKNCKGSNEDLEYISKSITKLSNYLKRKGVLDV
jgi:isochorismate hydrolase